MRVHLRVAEDRHLRITVIFVFFSVEVVTLAVLQDKLSTEFVKVDFDLNTGSFLYLLWLKLTCNVDAT